MTTTTNFGLQKLPRGASNWDVALNSNSDIIDTQMKLNNNQILESTGYGVINGLIVSAQSTPNMSVNISSGVLHTSDGNRLTPLGNNNLTITMADTTNPRIDIIYVNNDGSIGYTAGTPASSPIAPSISTGTFLLAQINVSANAISITNNNIIDKRKIKNITDNLATQLAENTNGVLSEFIKRLNNGQITKIKLIGDSITEGVGATGHISPPPNTQPVIFNDGAGHIYYEGDYDCNCWANLFRRHINSKYPSIQFVNAGIGGMSTKWGDSNKQYWVNDNEDVVFVQIGTNDRWDSATLSDFKTYLTSFLAYVRARCKTMIVMTATPTTNDFNTDGTPNTDYKFNMGEIDRVITDVCKENGYVHISNYRGTLNYVRYSGMSLAELIQTNGSHPVDLGHALIWQTIQQKIGLIDSVLNWQNPTVKYMSKVIPDQTLVTPTTSMFEAVFSQINMYYYTTITNTHPNFADFPDTSTGGGLLITYRSDVDLQDYQVFKPRKSNDIYIRYWNYDGTTWSWGDWSKIGSVKLLDQSIITNSLSIYNYPAKTVSYAIIASSNTDLASFPEGLRGLLTTNRFDSNSEGYSYQTYRVLQSNAVYQRYWLNSNAWSAWIKVGEPLMLDQSTITTTTTIYNFPVNAITYSLIAATNIDLANFPEGLRGSLETHRFDTSNEAYSYQTYRILATNRIYQRYWQNSGSWSAWEKVSAV